MKKIVYLLLCLIALMLLLSVCGCCEKTKHIPTASKINQTSQSREFIVGGVVKAYVCNVEMNGHDFVCIYSYGKIDALTHNPDCNKCTVK